MEGRVTAYIGLGGNMGEEGELFTTVLRRINAWPGVRLVAVSACYRTQPQGETEQPWFTNQVAALGCEPDITPESLLAALLALDLQSLQGHVLKCATSP